MNSLVRQKFVYLALSLIGAAGFAVRASASVGYADACFRVSADSYVQCYSVSFNNAPTDYAAYVGMTDQADFQGPGYSIQSPVNAATIEPDVMRTIGWSLTTPTTSGTFYVFGNHTFTTALGVPQQFFNSGQVTVF